MGNISFFAAYSPSSQEFIITPQSTSNIPVNYIISDSFKVEIMFHLYKPSIKEIGGRVENILLKNNIHQSDIHINVNNTICLCPYPKLRKLFPDRVNIIDYIDKLVIPCFYGLSFYEKYTKWPWGEYSHYDLGIYEYYYENRIPSDKPDMSVIINCIEILSDSGKNIFLKKKVPLNEDKNCPCKSGHKFKDCHKEAFQGLSLLLQDYNSLYPLPNIILKKSTNLNAAFGGKMAEWVKMGF